MPLSKYFAMTLYSKKYLKYLIILLVVIIAMVVSFYLHLTTLANNKAFNQTAMDDIQVFTPDWGVGATLVMMDHPPMAIGDKRTYPTWVDQPELPAQVIDAGIRGQPNVELLAQLQPDLILDTFFYENTRTVYDPSIPVYDIDFGIKNSNTEQRKTWTPFIQATYKIGTLLKKPEYAQRYVDNSKQRIVEAGRTVRKYIGSKKVLVVSFWDARQLQVDTINSYTTLALTTMGLEVEEIGDGSHWGTTSLPIHSLYELPKDTCLVITEPIPETTKYEIAHSPIWQRSPFFSPDACVYIIDPVWTNGGINVMVNFAENLAEAVTTQKQNEFSFEYVTQTEDDL